MKADIKRKKKASKSKKANRKYRVQQDGEEKIGEKIDEEEEDDDDEPIDQLKEERV